MSTSYLKLTIIIILALMTAFLSNDLYLPTMPVLQDYFHTTANLMQSTEAAWFAGSMALQLLVGPLSDAYGRRPVLMGSLGLLFTGSLLCALSPSIWWFIGGRFIQGTASSGIMAVGFASVHETAPNEREATKMLAFVSMATTAAPIIGPLVGGYIAQVSSWQMTFYIVNVLALVSMGICYFVLPESQLQRGPFNWRQQVHNYAKLINNTKFTTSVASYACMFFAVGAFLSGLPFVMVDILGYSIHQVGYGLIPLLLVYMLATGLTSSAVMLAKPTTIITAALGLAFSVMFAFTIASVELEPTLTLMLICMTAFYLGLGFAGPHLNNITLANAASNKGMGSALLTMFMMVGSTLGSSFMGLMYNGQLWSLAILLFTAVLFALISYGVYLSSLIHTNNEAEHAHAG